MKYDIDVKTESSDQYEDWSRNKSFTCLTCDKEVKGFRASWVHMKEYHPFQGDANEISNDLSEGEGSTEVGDHVESLSKQAHDSVDLSRLIFFQCIMCCKTYSRRDFLKIHMWRHLNAITPTPMHKTRGYSKSWAENNTWGCKKCPGLFPGLSALVKHNKVEHGMSNGFQCPVCDKDNFTKKDQLRAHVQTHNERKLPCEYCGKHFSDGNKMKRHINEVHQKQKNYMCNECGKCFARKDKLRSHEVVHKTSGDQSKQFLCYLCGRGFARQEHVSRHQKVCGLKQERKRELLQGNDDPNKELLRLSLELRLDEIERNPETKMFHCKECSHQFKDRRYIAEHYARNHSVQNLKLPYICEDCGRGYKIMKDLIRHRNKPHAHSEDNMKKSYVCQEGGCGRRFGREFELKRHINIHRGIRDHKCDYCEAAFHLRGCLKTHMKSAHDIELPRASRRRAPKGGVSSKEKSKQKRPRKRKKSASEKEVVADSHTSNDETLNLTTALNLSSSSEQWNPPNLNQPYSTQPNSQQQFSTLAQWMSASLEQPTMVPSTSNYYNGGAGTQFELHQHEADSIRSGTPAERNGDTPTSNSTSVSIEAGRPRFDHIKAAMNAIGLETPDTMNKSTFPVFVEEQHEQQELPDPNTQWESGDNSNEGSLEKCRNSNKRRNPGTPMTEEERSNYEDHMSEMKLGSICSVCGKVFRNRDALEYHIMTTKMPGHGILQVQKIKSNYAFASMQLSAKLSQVSRGCEKEDNIADKTFQDNNDQENNVQPELLDPKTGQYIIKEEVISNRTEKNGMDSEKKCLEKKEEVTVVNDLPVAVTIKAEPVEDIFKKPADVADTKIKMMKKKKMGKSKIFKCMECQKGFKRQAKLMKHVMKRHKASVKRKTAEQVGADIHELTKDAKDADGRWPCAICGKPLANKQKLQRHIMEVHQKLKHYICRICKKGFARAEKLKQHENEAHDEEELKLVKPIPVPELPMPKKEPLFKNGPQLKLTPLGCLDCNKSFSDKESVLEHMRVPPHAFDENAVEILCPVSTCNLSFTSVGRLLQHLRVGKHNQPCPVCAKTFKRLDKLEIHLRCHSSDRPFTCDMCSKSYKDPTSLQFHKKTHSGARPYICTECGAGFMKPDHLKRHVNSTHLRIKNVKCTFCDMYFSDKYKARIHERKHTGETPYLCAICAKGFKRKEALDQHVIVHKDLPKEFKCMTCSASFKSQQYLNRHVSRHFADKRWKCPKCPSAFIDRRDLVTHDKHVHQNLRPWICENCGSAYKTKQGLQIHTKSYPLGDCLNMKRFSGRGANRIDLSVRDEGNDIEKLFNCLECDKKFSKKSRLDLHVKMHANERPFPCTEENCNKSFLQNQTLRAHLKQFHQIELSPLPRGGGRKRSTTTTTTSPAGVCSSPLPTPNVSQQQHEESRSAETIQIPIFSVNNYFQKVSESSDTSSKKISGESSMFGKAEDKLKTHNGLIAHPEPKIPTEIILHRPLVNTSPMSNIDIRNAPESENSQHKSSPHSLLIQPQALRHQEPLSASFNQGSIPMMLQQQQQHQLQQQQQLQYQQQQHQQQQRLQQHLQQQQLQLNLQHHPQTNTFPGMPPNIIPSNREADQQHLVTNSMPIDFYQYAANFASNINIYKN